jgi:hypothetical protein
VVSGGTAQRSADLGEVANGEQGGPAGEVVAVVVGEVAGPGGAFAVAAGGVPGRDEVDLAGAIGDSVSVAQHDTITSIGGVQVPQEVAGAVSA